MSLDLPLVIANPKSAGGITEKQWASIVSALSEQLGPFDSRFTGAREDAIEIAEEEARRGRKFLIAVGGDGTVSEVANGILRSGAEAELGLLPRGTGGDFRMTIGMPSRIRDAARKLKEGKPRRIDVGKLTFQKFDGRETSRYFINTASFGMSGDVASRANASGKLLGGTLTYAVATVRSIFTYDHPEIWIEMDGESKQRLKVVTVCVANGPSFGGGMKIAPGAQPDDGVFHLTVIGDLKTTEMISNSHRLYTGSFDKMSKVAQLTVRKFSARPVNPDCRVRLEVDGETPGLLPATMEILPAALTVRC